MSNLRISEPVLTDPFEMAFRRFFSPVSSELQAPPLRMRLDIAEKGANYEVKADLPGVNKEDINVRVHGNIVQIDAEVKREKQTSGNGARWLRTERYEGSVSRSFSLAEDVDENKVQARYNNGVLTLELPKKAPEIAQKVMIQ